MRHAVHVARHDHGVIRGPQLIDRGDQYRAELGLLRWVIAARRLKVRREVVPRYFALSAAAAPHLAVGCVYGNAISTLRSPCSAAVSALGRQGLSQPSKLAVRLYDWLRQSDRSGERSSPEAGPT